MSPTRKRNILGICFVLMLILPSICTVSWLHYQRKQIRREVKNMIMSGLDKSDLIELTFDDAEISELKWKHDAEFEFEGRMYDIVASEQQNHQTTYWCWLDKEETALNAQLDDVLNIALIGNRNRRTKEIQLDNFMKSLLYVELSTPFLSSIESIQLTPYKNQYYTSITLRDASPPPEFL